MITLKQTIARTIRKVFKLASCGDTGYTQSSHPSHPPSNDHLLRHRQHPHPLRRRVSCRAPNLAAQGTGRRSLTRRYEEALPAVSSTRAYPFNLYHLLSQHLHAATHFLRTRLAAHEVHRWQRERQDLSRPPVHKFEKPTPLWDRRACRRLNWRATRRRETRICNHHRGTSRHQLGERGTASRRYLRRAAASEVTRYCVLSSTASLIVDF